MTKKDFKAIAEIILKKTKKDTFDGYLYVEEVSSDLADYFKSVNPNFNRDKFMEACFGKSH